MHVYAHGFTAGQKAVENQDWATGPLGHRAVAGGGPLGHRAVAVAGRGAAGPLSCFYQNQLRVAFHKYGPSCGTSQKIDFVYILIIGSP